MNRRLAIIAASLTLAAASAGAQPYPVKPIRLIVPFATGGGSDTVSRAISDRLSKALGQPLVIENRPGAGGSLGADLVAKSPADGYTMLVTDASAVTINPSLYPKLPYAAKDLTPVINLATFTLVLITPAKSPINSVAEFINADKAKPGGLSGASPGSGSSPHLMLEMMNSLAGTRLVHVPYKGGGPALTDVVGGQVDFSFNGLSSGAMSMIQAGKVKALAVTAGSRAPSLPQVPTLSESGFPGLDVISAQSLLVPAGTPQEIVVRLNAEISKILEMPEMKSRWSGAGFLPQQSQTPAQVAAWFAQESQKWGKLIKEKNITAD